jgi:hypothetical protein
MRVRRGMTIEEVRGIWVPRAEAKARAIMDSFYAQRDRAGGSYGHEGLGVYGDFKERAAREKVRLAVRLLEKAGLEVSYATIRKVTGQSESTIWAYWRPPEPRPPEIDAAHDEAAPARIIRFPGSPQR